MKVTAPPRVRVDADEVIAIVGVASATTVAVVELTVGTEL